MNHYLLAKFKERFLALCGEVSIRELANNQPLVDSMTRMMQILQKVRSGS